MTRFLRSLGFLDKKEREQFARAQQYEHYWYNAQKKLDLRRVEGFGRLARRVREEGRTYLHLDRLYTLWQGVLTSTRSRSSALITSAPGWRPAERSSSTTTASRPAPAPNRRSTNSPPPSPAIGCSTC